MSNGISLAQGAGPSSGQQALGSVPITLDKVRNLKFGHLAIYRFEEQTGLNLMVQAHPFGKPTLSLISVALWVALLHESPSMTLDEAVSLTIDHQDRWLEIMYALMDAWNVAYPKRAIDKASIQKRMDEVAKAATPDPSTGSPTGPSASTTSTLPRKRSGR